MKKTLSFSRSNASKREVEMASFLEVYKDIGFVESTSLSWLFHTRGLVSVPTGSRHSM